MNTNELKAVKTWEYRGYTIRHEGRARYAISLGSIGYTSRENLAAAQNAIDGWIRHAENAQAVIDKHNGIKPELSPEVAAYIELNKRINDAYQVVNTLKMNDGPFRIYSRTYEERAEILEALKADFAKRLNAINTVLELLPELEAGLSFNGLADKVAKEENEIASYLYALNTLGLDK